MEEKKVNLGRKLSLENAKLIGSGYFSEVYQISEDTVVKVLKGTDTAEAEREIRLAKWAFGHGMPTPISFDVVDVNGHPGLVYESLGRGNLKKWLLAKPEDFDEILRRYAELLRSINSIEVEPGRLPEAKDEYFEKLGFVRDMITPEQYENMSALLETIPERGTLLHRDCQIKNVRVVKGELYIIDLDTLSRGDPIFELMALCCCYDLFSCLCEGDVDDFFGMPKATLLRVYGTLLKLYFGGLPEAVIEENDRKIRLLASLHMLWFAKKNMPEKVFLRELMYKGFSEYLPLVESLRLEYAPVQNS